MSVTFNPERFSLAMFDATQEGDTIVVTIRGPQSDELFGFYLTAWLMGEGLPVQWVVQPEQYHALFGPLANTKTKRTLMISDNRAFAVGDYANITRGHPSVARITTPEDGRIVGIHLLDDPNCPKNFSVPEYRIL